MAGIRRTLVALALLVATGLAPHADAQSFEQLPTLPGNTNIPQPLDISDDGRVLVGVIGTTPVRWLDGEVVALPGGNGRAMGVSGDGLVIVGTLQNGPIYGTATRWDVNPEDPSDITATSINVGFSTIGSIASAVSNDGQVIAGSGFYTAGGGFERWQAFRWENGTATPLGFLGDHEFSGVAAMSADGSKLAGQSHKFRHEVVDGFYWDGTMSNVGEIESGAETYSNGMSANGQYIAGNTFATTYHAFRWSSAEGMMAIPFAAGADRMVGSDATNDGSVFGYWFVDDASFLSGSFRWTADNGTEDIATLLTDAGVDLAGFELSRLEAVTPDGSAIAGYGKSGNTWVAFRAVLAPSTSITVNETGDEEDFDTTDEACDVNATVAGDQCTLRAAIQTANAVTDGSAQTIKFDIDGTGPHTIAPTSPLPALTVNTRIDGTSQPGYEDKPVILLSGGAAGTGANGITIGEAGAGSTVEALAIDGFDGNGIAVAATNVTIAASWIGVGLGAIEAVGIGGNGIYASGVFDNLTIGRDSDPTSGNTIGNSGANGIFLEGPAGVATDKTTQSGINISVSHNLIGMIAPLGETPAAAGNILNAMSLQGIQNALVKLNTVGNSGMNGIELMGPQATGNTFEGNDVGGWFMRTGTTVDMVEPMANQLSGFFAHSGASGNNFGIDGGRPNTVVANKRYGLRFVNAHGNSILSSLFGVPADSTDQAPGKNGSVALLNLANVLGGLCLEDSGDNTIKGNIISNNGSEQGHAGVIVTGAASLVNRLLGNSIGTNSLGHRLGNIGSGILVTGGADETQIGGDTPELGNIIGANTGNGIYLKGQPLDESLADVAAGKYGPTDSDGLIAYRPTRGSAASINLGNIGHNLVGAFLKDGAVKEIGNGLNGICLLNAFKTVAKNNSFAANGKNGIEIVGPLSIENVFEGNAVGALAQNWNGLQSPSEVMPVGNGENGVHISAGALKNLFKKSQARPPAVMANAKYGFLIAEAHQNRVNDVMIGMIRNLPAAASKQTDASIINIGNGLGGICLVRAANNQIGAAGAGNVIANNGSDSTHAGIELLGGSSIGNQIYANVIGTTEDGNGTVGNAGPGILIKDALDTKVGGLLGRVGNLISGNLQPAIVGEGASALSILGNLIGAKSDSTTALPNGGDAISLQSSKAAIVDGNKIFATVGSGLKVFETLGARLFNNTFISHNAIHVQQSQGVLVGGTTVDAPQDTPAPPEARALWFMDTGDATISEAPDGGGNLLRLLGGNGIVFQNSKGTASATTVTGANTAISLQNAELQMKQMELEQSLRGIEATLNSQFEVKMSVIRNMEGSNSGIHMENSTADIRGVTITGDAGDAIWATGSEATIVGNNIVGNTGFGIRNVDAAFTLDATGNWWGHESGPAGEGAGSGDAVSANVDFSGWLESEIGFIVSAPDTVVTLPGDSIAVELLVSNLINPTDQVDLTLSDTGGWLASAQNVTIETGDEPAATNAVLQVPADATGGTDVTLTVDAASQTTPSLTSQVMVVLRVATPEATLALGAGATGEAVQSNDGSAVFTVVTNTNTGSADIRLFAGGISNGASGGTSGGASGGASGGIGDARAFSPGGSVARPLTIPVDTDGTARAWAFSATTSGAASAKLLDSRTGSESGAASPLTFDVCLAATGHNLDSGEIETALVLFRDHVSHEWTAQSSTSRDVDGTVHVCADIDATFGYVTLATGVPAPPSPPVAAFPGPARTGVASDPTLTWRGAIGAQRYQIQLSTNPLLGDGFFEDGDDLIANEELAGGSLALTGLATNTQHYWRLRSGSSLGFGPWSPVYSFTTSATGVSVEEVPAPVDVPESDGALATLSAGYPNPFSDVTTFRYTVGGRDAGVSGAEVTLTVYDALGRRVAVLADGVMPRGDHDVRFRPDGLAAGVYLVRLEARSLGEAGGASRGRSTVVATRTLVFVR